MAEGIMIHLHGGPAAGREFKVDPELFKRGLLRVPVERAGLAVSPYEIPTSCYEVATYERSLRRPTQWIYLPDGRRK